MLRYTLISMHVKEIYIIFPILLSYKNTRPQYSSYDTTRLYDSFDHSNILTGPPSILLVYVLEICTHFITKRDYIMIYSSQKQSFSLALPYHTSPLKLTASQCIKTDVVVNKNTAEMSLKYKYYLHARMWFLLHYLDN